VMQSLKRETAPSVMLGAERSPAVTGKVSSEDLNFLASRSNRQPMTGGQSWPSVQSQWVPIGALPRRAQPSEYATTIAAFPTTSVASGVVARLLRRTGD
jgi:hypothetical protein